jgi:uncharacterized protein (DUF952 family)
MTSNALLCSDSPKIQYRSPGTSKRNILRKGGGYSKVRKARAGSKDMTEDDFDGPAYLDENDPNYDPADDFPPIYHMCNRAQFEKATEGGGLYYSPTFEADNFIHATEEPSTLIDVANHFYKEDKGDWICIKLDPIKLGADVVWEKPAPVGDKAAYDHEGAPEFPHIYGGIPAVAVTERLPMERSADGGFLSIQGL